MQKTNLNLATLVKDVAQRFKNKMIQRKAQQKSRRIEKLRRAVEDEDLREASRRAQLIQMRTNVRVTPSFMINTQPRKSTYDRR